MVEQRRVSGVRCDLGGYSPVILVLHVSYACATSLAGDLGDEPCWMFEDQRERYEKQRNLSEGRNSSHPLPHTPQSTMVKRKFDPDSEDELKPDVKPTVGPDGPSSSSSSKSRPWTGAEQQLLLNLALEKGTKEAFKSVPGRTYNQCRMVWR